MPVPIPTVRRVPAALAAVAAFAALAVAAPATAGAIDQFTILVGDLVEPGVPGPGAGEIEAVGDVDRYDLDLLAGDVLYFDLLGQSAPGVRWRLLDPNDVEVFDVPIFNDGGRIDIDLTGTWTVEAFANGSGTGTYSFTTWIPQDDAFSIGIEEVVELGEPGPGAGEIEVPGSTDRYAFAGTAGQHLFFDIISNTSSGLRWRLFDPAGDEVFSLPIFNDSGRIVLDASGTYEIEVYGNGDATGQYALTIWETNVDGPFTIALETLVGLGVPGPGAGSIEDPGDVDQYEIFLEAGTPLYFQMVSNTNSGLNWSATAPDGSQVFSLAIFNDFGPWVAEETGVHLIEVFDNGDRTGEYEMIVWEVDDDGPFSIAVETVVEPGVPGVGAGDIEDPGNRDSYEMPVTAGDTLYFDAFDFESSGLRWSATRSDGSTVFSIPIFNDGIRIPVDADDTWTIEVFDTGADTGEYAFIVWVTRTDEFSIGLNQLFSPGVPGAGAGELEDPGDIDRYEIEGTAGDLWCARMLEFESSGIRYRLIDPAGDDVFSAPVFNAQPAFELPLDGTYVLEVFDNGPDTGTYTGVINRTVRADVDADCVVGFNDVLAVLAAWGPCDDPGDCPEDVDEDSVVGFADVLAILSSWTQ